MPNGGPQLTAKLSLDNKDFEKKIKDSDKQASGFASRLTKLAFRIPTAGINAATKAIRGMATALSSVGKAGLSGFGASALVGGWAGFGGAVASASRKLVSGVEDAYQYGREMMNLSRSLGIATDRISVFAQAFKDSEINPSEAIMAIKLLDQNLLNAAKGEAAYVHAFSQIGLAWQDLIQLSPDEAFLKVGKAVAGTINPVLRGAAAVSVFGRTGAKMLKLFERGGALENATLAVGGQAGIIGANGEAFERIAIRLSHVAVKARGVFVGIADALLPMVDKFSEKFDKMDFTAWGKKVGDALGEGISWLVVFWKEPKKTMGVFWEYAKLQALELGNTLLNIVDRFAPGLGDSIADFIHRTEAWGKITIGYAVDLGQTMLAGAKDFIAYLKQGWESTGIPEAFNWLKGTASAENVKGGLLNLAASSFGMPGQAIPNFSKEKTLAQEFLPPNWDNRSSREIAMQKKVDQWAANAAKNDPTNFQNQLDGIRKNGINGQAMVAEGKDILSRINNPKRFYKVVWDSILGVLGKDRLGAGAQRAKFEAAAEKLAPQKQEAKTFLKLTKPSPDAIAQIQAQQRISRNVQGMSMANAFSLQNAPHLQGASMVNNPWHNLGTGYSAYHAALLNAKLTGQDASLLKPWMFSMSGMNPNSVPTSGILKPRELRRFRDAAIANRAGAILAAGGDPSKLQPGEKFDRMRMRAPGETANGDKRRARAIAREIARRNEAVGTDNQLLGDIARNTASSAASLKEFVN